MIRAQDTDKTVEGVEAKRSHLAAANVYATLSLRDAVLEAAATEKKIATALIESNAELTETLKTATPAIIREIRKATVKPVPEREEGAA